MVNRGEARILLHDVVQLLQRQLDEVGDLQLVISENVRSREHEAGREIVRIEFHRVLQNGLRLHILSFLVEQVSKIVLKNRLIRRKCSSLPQVVFSAV